jgi:hypothetical protein
MREWYDSRTATLPFTKDLLKKCFVLGVDDIIYKYTQPVLEKSRTTHFTDIEEKFQMFDVMLLTYIALCESATTYHITLPDDEVIIVHADATLQVREDRKSKAKLDEVYNRIVKQMRPR